MSSPTRGLSSGQNPSWSLAFWNRFHRYRCLVRKFWWILVLTLSIATFFAAWYQMTRPQTFLSTATLNVNVENEKLSATGGQSGGVLGSQDLEAFMMTQVDFITKNSMVKQLATENLHTKYPNQVPSEVQLDVTPHNTFLSMSATGSDPVYTQRYLQSFAEGFLKYRLQTKTDYKAEASDKFKSQIPFMLQTLNDDDAAIVEYQRANHVVFGKDDVNANNELVGLRQKLATLNDELNQLTLMTPEDGLEHRRTQAPGAGGADTSAQTQNALVASPEEASYRGAQDQLSKLTSEYDDWARDLRPAHPRMVALDQQIRSQKKILANMLQYVAQRIKDRRELVASSIKTTEEQIKTAKPEVAKFDLLKVAYDNLVEKKRRDQSTYEGLQNALNKVTVESHTEIDPVKIMEPASPATPVPSSWLKAMLLALVGGGIVGVGILALVDRLDDRMGSINDFQAHFSEHVIGQIPRDGSKDVTELLRPDDQRHQLVESFRNLRSTLLYMPMEGERPKTLLVTSAVPNEGKSTLSSNLALVMAFAGMKTLLIDADLRRGAIHQSFGITRGPGLTDVLGHNVNWKIAIRTTNVDNLHVLPRGRNVPQPSEYLLNRNTDKLLKELYPLYDYIIIDSSPVLAADDTASLAPKIDATLFVVRLAFTSAKMTRKSLEILYDRQANIPGLILNQVDTSSPEFVYYQYSEYYHTATGEDDEPAAEPAKPVQPVQPQQPEKPVAKV